MNPYAWSVVTFILGAALGADLAWSEDEYRLEEMTSCARIGAIAEEESDDR